MNREVKMVKKLDRNSFSQILANKIRGKSAVIGIVGLGYVGLPLAIAFSSAGYKVIGIDLDQNKISSVNRGESYLLDIKSEQLKKIVKEGNLRATSESKYLGKVDISIICVPTPLTKTKEPDLTFINESTIQIAKYLHKGQLIILESTTYPGTTREVVFPVLESTGLRIGRDYFLTFSPERVDPGSKHFTIKNTPKVVGGMEPESTKLAAELYKHVSEKVVEVSTPEAAEMDKVFENVFRSVNIAMANELAKLCEKMNISVWEVIKAASSKPFGYMPFYPGPGVGGHCIPLDPYYLASKARAYDFHTRFIELAAEINETMPDYIVGRIVDALNIQSKSVNKAKVFLLGVTYKKDVEDMRESPILRVIELLLEKGTDLYYHDPYVPELKVKDTLLKSVKLGKKELSSSDCVVITSDHSCFNLEFIVNNSKLILDTRGATVNIKNNKILRLGEPSIIKGV
jgi:UDP-N-acetyl-D-glucosamine dehydrogenase